MAKRKATIDFGDVMNDINQWLEDEDNELENDLDELNGDRDEDAMVEGPSEENALKDVVSESEEEPDDQLQRVMFRKQLTYKRLVHSIDSALDEANFKPIVYINQKGNFEELTYLGPKNNKNTKTLTWGSDYPPVVGRQHVCDTITGPTSCLLPNTKALEILSSDDAFHLFFDDNIMDRILNKTNKKIQGTIRNLQTKETFRKSDKYSWIKETDKIELNALFGLM